MSEITTVENRLFLGRVEEQKQFRAALHEVLDPSIRDDFPYVVLLYGDGGIGKTTLGKRFRDIALLEQPFQGSFDSIWVDWETEYKRFSSLQVGRENVSPEAVFEALHAVILRHDKRLGRHFKKFQDAIKLRRQIDKKLLDILQSTKDEKDQFAQIRKLGASAIAKIVRWKLPIGEGGEALVREFLDIGIETSAHEATKLRHNLEGLLRSRLKPEQYEIFLAPEEQLAVALGDGLKRLAQQTRLILCLDTYEIVDRSDLWLRSVILNAGSRVVWIISGRNNLLKSREFGIEYFRGYSDDFPRRLLAYDIRQLAVEDIKTYFLDITPNRPLKNNEAEAISRATRGIPLAIREAADIWAAGANLNDIIMGINADTPRTTIVQTMTERYLFHVVKELDRQALYALALAKGDPEVIRAMLDLDNTNITLHTWLQRLSRDYSSVHADEARLHDEPSAFLMANLQSDIFRTEQWVVKFFDRGIEVIQARLLNIEATLTTVEARYDDNDWCKLALDLTRFLFWRDEMRAWKWFSSRFIESIPYSDDFLVSLLHIAFASEEQISSSGQRRLKILRPFSKNRDFKMTSEIIAEFNTWENLGWLAGENEKERIAILSFYRGRAEFHQKRFQRAFMFYDIARQNMPKHSVALRNLLITIYQELGWELAYAPDGYVKPSEDGLKAFRHAIELTNEYSHNEMLSFQYNCAGEIVGSLGRTVEAIELLRKSVELLPKDVAPYLDLAAFLAAENNEAEAIDILNRFLEQNPDDIRVRGERALLLYTLLRYDEALADVDFILKQDPSDQHHLELKSRILLDLDNYHDALQSLNYLVELNPQRIVPIRRTRARILGELGCINDAMEDYEFILSQLPGDVEALTAKGYFALKNQSLDEAIRWFQEALKYDSKNYNTLYGLGLTYFQQGLINQSLDIFIALTQLVPDDNSAFNNCGFLNFQLGNIEEACSFWQIAVNLPNPGDWMLAGYAIALWKLGRFEQSKLPYQEAVKLDSRWSTNINEISATYFWTEDMQSIALEIINYLGNV